MPQKTYNGGIQGFLRQQQNWNTIWWPDNGIWPVPDAPPCAEPDIDDLFSINARNRKGNWWIQKIVRFIR